LDAGAEDVRDQGDQFEVITTPADLDKVKAVFDQRGMVYEMAQVTMVPQTTIRVEDEKTAQQLLKLMDALEDNDDVQNAYANFDIPDEILNAVA
jgi:transcriptional/translational regulatory protein YebC/TACO1